MPQLINYGNEMIRISSKGIEYSINGGRSWNNRYLGSAYGIFIDLLPYGNELLAVTTKGLYNSINGGRTSLMVMSCWLSPQKAYTTQ